MSSQAPERGGKAAASRQRILDCAARLFRANGYAATALGDIAAASGLRTASLYYHFASKEDLVREVLRISAARTFDAARAAVAALPADARFDDRLAAAIAAHLDELLGHADYTSADLRIVNQVPDAVRRDVLPIRRDYADWWSPFGSSSTGICIPFVLAKGSTFAAVFSPSTEIAKTLSPFSFRSE